MAKLVIDDEDDASERLSNQAITFFLHTFFALGAWIAMMLVGYAINPTYVPQAIVLGLSILVPMFAGNLIVKFKPNEMSMHVWLAGLIWFLMICLWILDMPTGPNACFECDATAKVMRTLFSFPSPSGLIDNNGPFFGTWPAAALLGYSLGARLGLRRMVRSTE
jgi:hypothetical protein